ncbi:MAG TPA: ABC transporter permease [Candidatus Eisenbacteria bacterium]|nr:ABC transporter permease [Candidatus Eisenbacteria bacterium]
MVAWSEVLREALRALERNKIRTVLTMLGVIIGVAAVIATLAIGQGAKQSVQEQIRSLGSNVIMVFSGGMMGVVRTGTGTVQGLTVEDAQAITRECPSVAVASPTVRSQAQVVAGDANWSTTVQGGDENYLTVRDWPVVEGRTISTSDVRAAMKVCIIGATVKRELFGDGEAVGSTIRIRRLPFQVIGVLATKGSNSFGQDQDDQIIAPLTTVQKKILANPLRVGSIMVSARSEAVVDDAIEEISNLLRQRHRIAPGQQDDFMVRSQSEIASTAEGTSQVMTLLLSSVAFVSLLVGGIGIMNIMLVSVTERTREIGVRRALGARAKDIMVQFLAESAFVSVVGGTIGIGLGMGIAYAVSHFAQWPTLIGPESIALAFGFSALVGIFFGFYPARTAARLNPIESLRYE